MMFMEWLITIIQLVCMVLGLGIALVSIWYGIKALKTYYQPGYRNYWRRKHINICKKLFVMVGGAFVGGVVMIGPLLIIADVPVFLFSLILLIIVFSIISIYLYIIICLPHQLRK